MSREALVELLAKVVRATATWNPAMWAGLSGMAAVISTSAPLWMALIGTLVLFAVLAASLVVTFAEPQE